jgi:hypothetical protein
MGLKPSILTLADVPDKADRLFFISFDDIVRRPEAVVYKFTIRFQRYRWVLLKRFSEFKTLDVRIRSEFEREMAQVPLPQKFSKMFWSHSDTFLRTRGSNLRNYMLMILDRVGERLLASKALADFLEIGPVFSSIIG